MLANQNKKFEPTVCIKQNELRSHINFQTCSPEFKIFPATSNLKAFCQVAVQLLSSLEFQVYWKQYVVCMIMISKERTGMVDLENLSRIQVSSTSSTEYLHDLKWSFRIFPGRVEILQSSLSEYLQTRVNFFLSSKVNAIRLNQEEFHRHIKSFLASCEWEEDKKTRGSDLLAITMRGKRFLKKKTILWTFIIFIIRRVPRDFIHENPINVSSFVSS